MHCIYLTIKNFSGGLSIYGYMASIEMEGCMIDNAKYALYFETGIRDITLTNTSIVNSIIGIQVNNASSVVIQDSLIEGNVYPGFISSSYSLLEFNTFSRNTNPIQFACYSLFCNISIEENDFDNTQHCVKTEGYYRGPCDNLVTTFTSLPIYFLRMNVLQMSIPAVVAIVSQTYVLLVI